MPMAATVILIVIAALGSIFFLFVRQDQAKPSFMTNLFKVSPFWTITRDHRGHLRYSWSHSKLDRKLIWNENTGGLSFSADGLVTFLFTIFFFAGLLLPLLLNFGLLEFFGTMMVKIMRPVIQTAWSFFDRCTDIMDWRWNNRRIVDK